MQDLLVFARIQSSYRECVDLNNILRESIDLRDRQHAFDEINIVQEFSGDMRSISGNPHQIKQVFLNILLNAEQAMGTVSITRGAHTNFG